jgi:hypothetical protein
MSKEFINDEMRAAGKRVLQEAGSADLGDVAERVFQAMIQARDEWRVRTRGPIIGEKLQAGSR